MRIPGWRLTKKILLWSMLTLVSLTLIFVAINLFKSKPSPLSQQLAQPAPNPYANRDNLFLALAALNLPEMEDRFGEANQRILHEIAQYRQLSKKHLTSDEIEKSHATHAVIGFVGEFDLCKPHLRPCLPEVAAHHTNILISQKKNALLLERYRLMPTYAGFYETSPPSLYRPAVYFHGTIRKLFLASVADTFLNGNLTQRTEALSHLTSDIRTSKKILSGYGGLISKMIAVANLHQSLSLLSEIINHQNFNHVEFYKIVQPTLEDLHIPDFSSLWADEYRFVYHVWDEMLESADTRQGETLADQILSLFLSKPLDRIFFDLSDTRNIQANDYQRLIEISKLPPSQALLALQAFDKNADNFNYWKLYRNPVGRTLAALTLVQYSQYNYRIYDIFAYQQLTLLSLQLRAKQTPSEQINGYLVQTGNLSKHPASHMPFYYDPHQHTLTMTPLVERKDRRYSISLYTTNS